MPVTGVQTCALPIYKEFSLAASGWHLLGDSKTYHIDELEEDEYYVQIFYKDRWIKEDLSGRKMREGQSLSSSI